MNREEILRRFEAWLDTALASEDPPAGVEADILTALESDGEAAAPAGEYALWSAITALTQEVRLQGRSFKELNETLGAQANRATERELRDAELRGRREFIAVLIDLRDRFGRGLESVRASEAEMAKAPPPGLLARLFAKTDAAPPQAVQALKKGYQLSLERLDQTLEEFSAREIRCEGQPFDPRRMNAVDREETASLPEGTVIEVYRSGYEWNGEVFRTAQVKVACRPAGKDHE